MAVALPQNLQEGHVHYGLVVLNSFGNRGQPERDCSSATGVAFNRDNEILVADPTYNRIQVFTTRGHLRRAIKSSFPGDGTLHSPLKVAVNLKNGTIYVTERSSNLGIRVFNSNGFFIKSFGKHESPSETKALTVDNENNVLLLELKGSERIIMSIINENGHAYRRKLSSTLRSPNGFAAWGGRVYISDDESDFIKILAYSGKQIGQFERLIKRTFGVCVSADGDVHVGSKTFDGFKITKFRADGTFVSVHNSRTYHHAIRNMTVQGEQVVLATCDGIYVYGPIQVRDDQGGSRVSGGTAIVRTTMNLHRAFGLQDDSGKVNTRPPGVAASTQSFTDTLYVSDSEQGRIQVFDSSGLFLGRFESRLTNPRKITVDRVTNNILVINEGPQPHIVVFNWTGDIIHEIGKGDLIRPINLALNKCGKIFLIEYDSSSLKVFDYFGSKLYLVHLKAARFPTDIAISEKDEIFIAENSYHCIQVYNYSGELLRRIGNYTITRTPLFVAIVREGLIVVVDKTLHVNLTYFTEEGSFVAAYQSNTKHMNCNDISVLSDESIVVASDATYCQMFLYYAHVNP